MQSVTFCRPAANLEKRYRFENGEPSRVGPMTFTRPWTLADLALRHPQAGVADGAVD